MAKPKSQRGPAPSEVPSLGDAVVYARVSTKQQRTTEQQVELCRRRLEDAGYRVRYILREEGWSARTVDRPMFKRLIELVASDRVDALGVWKLDRVCRSLRDLMNTHAFLEEHEVRLISVTESIDTSSSFGRFAFRNIASAAELESDLIGERARLGKMRSAAEGKWLTNQAPFGYDLNAAHELEVNPGEAEVVRQVFGWYAVDRLPLTEISRRLGAVGVVSKGGRSFSPSGVLRLVRNPVYRGIVESMGEVEVNADLAIVEDEVWQEAQDREGEVCHDGRAQERRVAAMDAVMGDYFRYLDSVEPEVLALRVRPGLPGAAPRDDASNQTVTEASPLGGATALLPELAAEGGSGE